jgi:hypothetical protein
MTAMHFAPGYWMHESTGVLRPAVKHYLNNEPMTVADIAAMCAYLRQWMSGPWRGEELEALRLGLDRINSREAIDDWIELAAELGIDPL